MYCASCGKSVPDSAAFCPHCGNTLGEVALAETSLQTQVANGEDNALLNDLLQFQTGYHELVRAGSEVNRLQRSYKQVEGRGNKWYYENSNDEQIVASREIDAQVSKANASVANCRQALSDNEKRRVDAREERDKQVAWAERDQEKADKSYKRRTGCSAMWYAVGAFIFLGFIVTSFSVSQNKALFLIVGGVGLVYSLVRFMSARKKREEKTQTRKADAQASARNAESELERNLANLAAQDAATQGKLDALDAKLKALVPQANDLRKKAYEQAEYYYNADLHKQGLALREASNTFVQCYQYLKQLNTVPSENDWSRIDQIVEFVRSGRADTLKEALLLVSQAEFQAGLLETQQALVYAQERTNEVLAEGFSDMLASQEELIERQQALFDTQIEIQAKQHAQQMAAQASQFALQAEQLNQETQIRSNQEAAYAAQQAAYSEQAAFHDEVRSQPGWVDPDERR